MKLSPSLPLWSLALPLAATGYYLLGWTAASNLASIVGALLLMGSVLSAVHHAEVVAHKVGEPFGTIILALAITILEVGLIVSMMMAGGEDATVLARDTVFAAIMLILNGILGISLLIGGVKYREQYFGQNGVGTALVALVAILTLCLILPNFTSSSPGPTYSMAQMLLVAIACLVIYGTFILVQTVRHRDYFLDDDDESGDHHAEPPSVKIALISLIFLLICLAVVVLMSKALSPLIEGMVKGMGAPVALVGVIIAAVVLLPEGLAALRAARRNRFQTSLNLALGSALASIGLTIPAVIVVCLVMDIPLILGLTWKSMILLSLSIFTVMLSLNQGKTNILYGVVLLVNLVIYVFTVIVP
ncbi:calcium:proton antiporter [Snodgrassella sp. CFCC 13594]|uniref:calcium:proton antiporter n=1 Tax=Snodgrassella sp. CFCC 13594 TaxID=1775559 RepID=UPI00082E3F30|nr:ionic transporter y4hA [Snodgrassella sp. CFCC 13594]